MKVGIITKPNLKGQVVIPKQFRDSLGMNQNTALNLTIMGQGIFITPINEVVTSIESENSYLDLLKKTKGKWEKNYQGEALKEKKRIELEASSKRKLAW